MRITSGDSGDRPPGLPPRSEEEPPLLKTERLHPKVPSPVRRRDAVRIAWVVALAADAVQFVVWPLFAGGAASPLNDVLDVIVAAILVGLLGWHWAFLPAFVAEIVPGVDLVPTWTIAVFLATRGARDRQAAD